MAPASLSSRLQPEPPIGRGHPGGGRRRGPEMQPYSSATQGRAGRRWCARPRGWGHREDVWHHLPGGCVEGFVGFGDRLSLQKLARYKTGGRTTSVHRTPSHPPAFTPAVLRVWSGDLLGVHKVKTVFIIILRSDLPFYSLMSVQRDFLEATIT